MHLGSPVKSGKIHSINIRWHIKVWLLLFLMFTCYCEKYMALSDSWQEQSRLQRVKGVNKCFWGAGIVCDQNTFVGECWIYFYLFLFLSCWLCCPVFQTQQVVQIYWSARKWFYFFFCCCCFFVVIKSQVVKWNSSIHKQHKESDLIDLNSKESGCDFLITIIVNIIGLLLYLFKIKLQCASQSTTH